MSWIPWGYVENSPRCDFGAITKTISKEVFVIGGKCNFEALKNCDIWDFETKRWTAGPDLPIKMKFCRAVLFNRYIYVIGPFQDFFCLNTDNIGRGWIKLPDAKVDGLGCELVSDEKYIYRIGDNFQRTSFHRYDPEEQTWESLPQMEKGRDFLGAAVLCGKIYVTGGRTGHSGDTILSSVCIYDIDRKEWNYGPNLPKQMYSHSAVAIHNFIFVSGGLKGYGHDAFSSCYILNTETDEWTELRSSLPRGFSGHSVIVWGYNVFIIGGVASSYDDEKTHQIYTYDLKYALEDSDDTTVQSGYTQITSLTKHTATSAITEFFSRACCKSPRSPGDLE